jgi:hypothetical protein
MDTRVVFKEVAKWFIELDDGGMSFIDIPLYANTSALRSHKHKDILKKKKDICGVKNIEELFNEAKHCIGQEKRASYLFAHIQNNRNMH